MIMESQQMTQQNFAQFIGMSPASLSSIFNGRTQPTIKIVEAIKSKLPSINIDWLMFGTGAMYNENSDISPTPTVHQHPMPSQSVLDFGDAQATSPEPLAPQNVRMAAAEQRVQNEKIVLKNLDKTTRKITEIRVFYDDQTWETFVPQKK